MLPFIIFIPWLLAWPGEERNRRSLKKKTKENVKEENEDPKRERERGNKKKEKSALRWRVGKGRQVL